MRRTAIRTSAGDGSRYELRTETPTEDTHSPDRTVCILDDRDIQRGLACELLAAAGFSTLEANSEAEIIPRFGDCRSGCLLVAAHLADSFGGVRGFVVELFRNEIDLPLIVLGPHADADEVAKRAVSAIQMGAADYVVEPVRAERLVEAVLNGFEADLRRQPRREIRSRYGKLTPRQKQVMLGVLDGGSTKAIAEALSISDRTVETHRGDLMRSLGAASLADLLHIGRVCDDLIAAEAPPFQKSM